MQCKLIQGDNMIDKKPFSASLSKENIEYIENEVAKKQKEYPRYKKSHWLDDLVTHLRTKNKNAVAVTEKPVKKSKAFKAPSVEEVWQYCNERCNNVDAQEFVDHYTANNWFRGKTKINDWKACVRTWEKNSTKTRAKQQGKTSGNLEACERFING